MPRAALLAALLGGCSILSLPPDGGPYGCRGDSDCAPLGLGLVCRGGYCLSLDAGPVSDGGRSDAGLDSGSPDAGWDGGADAGTDAGCTPENPCDLGTVDWSNGVSVCVDTGVGVADGTPCAAGTNVCVGGECRHGCFIAGGPGFVEGSARTAGGCKVCDPSQSLSDWTPAGEGALCDAGVCTAAGDCQPGCSIDGGYVALRTLNPDNPCLACHAANVSDWTPVPDGNDCGHGRCVGGVCSLVCWFDGGLFADAGPEPGNPCMACDPSRSMTEWVQSDGPSCDAGVCYGGLCRQDGCFIADAGVFVEEDASYPGDICWHCDLQDPTAWTELGDWTVVDAGYCHNDAQASIYGYHYGCLLPGDRPFPAGGRYGDCLACDPERAVTGLSAIRDGLACAGHDGGGGFCHGGSCETSCLLPDGGGMVSVENDHDLYLGLPASFDVMSDAGATALVAVFDDAGVAFSASDGLDGGLATFTWTPSDGGQWEVGPYSVLATVKLANGCEQAEDDFFLRTFVSPNDAGLSYSDGLVVTDLGLSNGHPVAYASPQPDAGPDYTVFAEVEAICSGGTSRCSPEFGVLFRIKGDGSALLFSNGWGGGGELLFGSISPSEQWNPAAIGSSVTPLTLTAGHRYLLRVKASGTSLAGQIWDADQPSSEAEVNATLSASDSLDQTGIGLGFYTRGSSGAVVLQRLTTQ